MNFELLATFRLNKEENEKDEEKDKKIKRIKPPIIL